MNKFTNGESTMKLKEVQKELNISREDAAECLLQIADSFEEDYSSEYLKSLDKESRCSLFREYITLEVKKIKTLHS